MSGRKRLVLRLHRLFLYWGLLSHPFGRDYVRTAYSPTGGTRGTLGSPTADPDVDLSVDASNPNA